MKGCKMINKAELIKELQAGKLVRRTYFFHGKNTIPYRTAIVLVDDINSDSYITDISKATMKSLHFLPDNILSKTFDGKDVTSVDCIDFTYLPDDDTTHILTTYFKLN